MQPQKISSQEIFILFVIALVIFLAFAIKASAGSLEDKKANLEYMLKTNEYEKRAVMAEAIVLQSELAKVNQEIQEAEKKAKEKEKAK